MKPIAWTVLAAALIAASPSAAVETLTATFTDPDGGVTAKAYAGIVRVTVSGVGHSLAQRWNDAFYLYSPLPIGHDARDYQLTFSTTSLAGNARMHAAVNSIVGGVPAYDPSHVYTFLLDTGATTPAPLHFGVSDGMYSDNLGDFVLAIAIPEPATWALMIGGFGVVGTALRRRTTTVAA